MPGNVVRTATRKPGRRLPYSRSVKRNRKANWCGICGAIHGAVSRPGPLQLLHGAPPGVRLRTASPRGTFCMVMALTGQISWQQ